MDEKIDGIGLWHGLVEGVDDAVTEISGSGGYFSDAQLGAGFIPIDKVGEGAANIGCNAHWFQAGWVLTGSVWSKRWQRTM